MTPSTGNSNARDLRLLDLGDVVIVEAEPPAGRLVPQVRDVVAAVCGRSAVDHDAAEVVPQLQYLSESRATAFA